MADPDRTQKILSELHAWGLTLAIDDFGTGYSSLARLKHMPVDILKIDQAFVRNVDRDIGLAGMVRAMIQLAQSLNMVPLAEGIETQGEIIFLRANGCRLAQGFLFARPVPAAEIPALALRKGGLFPPYLLVEYAVVKRTRTARSRAARRRWGRRPTTAGPASPGTGSQFTMVNMPTSPDLGRGHLDRPHASEGIGAPELRQEAAVEARGAEAVDVVEDAEVLEVLSALQTLIVR